LIKKAQKDGLLSLNSFYLFRQTFQFRFHQDTIYGIAQRAMPQSSEKIAGFAAAIIITFHRKMEKLML
jgi:hypothetical protein